jgi:hypothetical protein
MIQEILMNTIIPQSQELKKAVKWISEQLKEDENKSKQSLINEAISRFDLNPKQSMFLLSFYKNH